MSSDGNAPPNAFREALGAMRQAAKARDPKHGSDNAPKPAPGLQNASMAANDEALAKEALEGLKRIRAKARLDKMAIPKPAPVIMRPAVIMAKPPAPRPAWVVPLATLATAVGLVVTACTGVIAYMTMQPSQTHVAANTEIRNLRETVTQLRRQVSSVSESLDGLRAAVDLSSRATNDRFGRFAENLDRIERVSSSSTAKLDKLAQVQSQAPAAAPTSATTPQSRPAAQEMPVMVSAAYAPEITGSVPAPERTATPRKVVKGWSVRQAYEGIAILEGPNGVVEAVLGQQVPGLGRIEEIKTENGHLMVLSSSGAILPARKGMH
jgi:hypothetical protein